LTDTKRTSLVEHTEFTTGGIYTATVNRKEAENKEQRANQTTIDWEYDWMDNQDKGDTQWESNDDNRNKVVNGEENSATATQIQEGERGGSMPSMSKIMY
jgi:hypothetical protein